MREDRPIGLRNIRSPSKMPLDSRCSSFKYRFFVYLMLVISVAHFSPEAPGFVVESVSSKFLDLFYLLVGVILVLYGLISRKGVVGKNVEMSLGFKASIDYVEEILLNVECMRDFESCGGFFGNAEWLGLPVRSLKSVVDEKKGVNCYDGGFCEKGDREFGELSPVNLLEKFNEASMMFRGRVVPVIRSSRNVASGGFAGSFVECGNQMKN